MPRLPPSRCWAPRPAAPHYPGTYSESEAANLDKLSAYLNSIHTLKSNFVQLGPEGDLAQGEFDLSRPGQAALFL